MDIDERTSSGLLQFYPMASRMQGDCWRRWLKRDEASRKIVLGEATTDKGMSLYPGDLPGRSQIFLI